MLDYTKLFNQYSFKKTMKLISTDFATGLINLVNNNIERPDLLNKNKSEYFSSISKKSLDCYEIGENELIDVGKKWQRNHIIKEKVDSLNDMGLGVGLVKVASKAMLYFQDIRSLTSSKKSLSEGREYNNKILDTYNNLVSLSNNRVDKLDELVKKIDDGNNLFYYVVENLKEVSDISLKLKDRQEKLVELEDWLIEFLYNKK